MTVNPTLSKITRSLLHTLPILAGCWTGTPLPPTGAPAGCNPLTLEAASHRGSPLDREAAHTRAHDDGRRVAEPLSGPFATEAEAERTGPCPGANIVKAVTLARPFTRVAATTCGLLLFEVDGQWWAREPFQPLVDRVELVDVVATTPGPELVIRVRDVVETENVHYTAEGAVVCGVGPSRSPSCSVFVTGNDAEYPEHDVVRIGCDGALDWTAWTKQRGDSPPLLDHVRARLEFP